MILLLVHLALPQIKVQHILITKSTNWKSEPGEATVGTEKMTGCPSVSPVPSGLAHAAPGKCKKRGGLSNKERKALLSSILLWPTFTDSFKQQRKSMSLPIIEVF